MNSALVPAARLAAVLLLLAGCAADPDSPSSNDQNGAPGSGSGGANAFGNAGQNNASGGNGQTSGGAAASGGTAAGSGGASTNDATGGGAGAAGSSSSSSNGTSNASGGAGGSDAANGGAGTGDSTSSGDGIYVTAGDWHGYAWPSASGAGTTIDPTAFSGIAEGDPLCVSGTVAPTADFSGVAMVGVNLNQERLGNDTPHPVSPTQAGISVSITNRGSSPLRVQVQGANGATDANDRWCVPLSGSGGFYTWSSFNTACWDNSGNDYAGEPIVAVMILVPGDDTNPVAYDFCLNAFMQADGPGGGSGGTGGDAGGSGGSGSIDPGNNSGSGTLTMPLEWAAVMRDGRNYVVQNNVWGGSSNQTVTYSGTTFEITQQTGSNSTSSGPVSYPSVFIGSNNSRNTAGSNLPKQVSALTTVDTAWSHNAGSVSGTYNAAYDVWFSTSSGGDAGSPSGGYLMVWLYDPDGAQPIGSVVQSGVSIDGASGSWDVWLGDNGGKPVISYVRTSPATSLQFDLNKFIQHAVARGGSIQSNWYLTNVFAGFEIWSGGVGLKTTAFYAIVN